VWTRPNIRDTRGWLNLYCRVSVIKTIRERLRDCPDATIYKRFKESCFGRYLEYDPVGYCANSAIYAVLAHQITRPDARPDEAWFRVREKFARFSKKEHALVTGLRFGTSDFDVRAKHDYPQGGLYMRYVHGTAHSSNYGSVFDRFSSGEFAASPEDELKFAKLIFLYGFVLGIDNNKKVEQWAWALIDEEEKWDNFPWGSYTFDDLIGRISKVNPTLQRDGSYRGHFYGFSTAFMVCSYFKLN
jgi:Domain of unknown function (DUF1985)